MSEIHEKDSLSGHGYLPGSKSRKFAVKEIIKSSLSSLNDIKNIFWATGHAARHYPSNLALSTLAARSVVSTANYNLARISASGAEKAFEIPEHEYCSKGIKT